MPFPPQSNHQTTHHLQLAPHHYLHYLGRSHKPLVHQLSVPNRFHLRTTVLDVDAFASVRAGIPVAVLSAIELALRVLGAVAFPAIVHVPAILEVWERGWRSRTRRRRFVISDESFIVREN